MGIGDKGILSVGTDMEKTVLEMIGEMIDEDSALPLLHPDIPLPLFLRSRWQNLRSFPRHSRCLKLQNAENEIRAAEENEPEVPAEEKEMGFISVSIGEGIKEIFRGLGVDYIIEGGQTMNPSTEAA